MIDVARRATGALGLSAIALIHLLDLESKWHETKYQFVLLSGYVLLEPVGRRLQASSRAMQALDLRDAAATELVAG